VVSSFFWLTLVDLNCYPSLSQCFGAVLHELLAASHGKLVPENERIDKKINSSNSLVCSRHVQCMYSNFCMLVTIVSKNTLLAQPIRLVVDLIKISVKR